jgi:type I restriction enzyme S subunit
LPSRWIESTIGQLFSTLGGGTPLTDNPDYWGHGITWFSSADIDESGRIISRRFVTADGLQHSTTKVASKGCVVVVTRVGLGKLAMLDFDMCFSQDNQALIPNYPSLVFNRFLFYFLCNEMQMLKYSGRGTTISGITKKRLTDIHFFIPPLAEQRRIVAAIETAFVDLESIAENLS